MTAIVPAGGGRRRARPRARIVHLGLGAFSRAHLAWYTDHVDDARDWGIAAFTGRSAGIADSLAPQDGLYTLITRAAQGDRAETIESVVAVHDGSDLDALAELLEQSDVAVVTLTITEKGYRLRADGTPDPEDDALTADVERLRGILRTGIDGVAGPDRPTTALGRLLYGLHRRRTASGAPLAVVPCDNVPDNGAFLRTGTTALAGSVDPLLRAWIEANVSFVSTSVDRITPRTTDRDLETARELIGADDAAPVVTEPFSDWILSGAFPAGRPAWEKAGARFVDGIEPWERRKLWLLNGAHTLLALAGPPRGHTTVAEAIADPVLRGAVEAFWDEAAALLPSELGLDEYRAALLERFGNPRIEHRLAQIALDSDTKVRVRIVPVALATRARGAEAVGAARVVAAYLALLSPEEREPSFRSLSPELARDAAFRASVLAILADRAPLPFRPLRPFTGES